jgi:hypothetical protein
LLIAGIIFGLPGLIIAWIWLMTGFVVLLYFHDLSLRGFLAPLRVSRRKRTEFLNMRHALVGSFAGTV